MLLNIQYRESTTIARAFECLKFLLTLAHNQLFHGHVLGMVVVYILTSTQLWRISQRGRKKEKHTRRKNSFTQTLSLAIVNIEKNGQNDFSIAKEIHNLLVFSLPIMILCNQAEVLGVSCLMSYVFSHIYDQIISMSCILVTLKSLQDADEHPQFRL